MVLSIGVLILVLITSLGIYGFLTSPFQDTFNMFSVNEKQKTFLQQKEKFYSDDKTRDTMRNLKEYLITLVLFPITKSQQSKYETHRLWGY